MNKVLRDVGLICLVAVLSLVGGFIMSTLMSGNLCITLCGLIILGCIIYKIRR